MSQSHTACTDAQTVLLEKGKSQTLIASKTRDPGIKDLTYQLCPS